jgi:hypothetical protein
MNLNSNQPLGCEQHRIFVIYIYIYICRRYSSPRVINQGIHHLDPRSNRSTNPWCTSIEPCVREPPPTPTHPTDQPHERPPDRPCATRFHAPCLPAGEHHFLLHLVPPRHRRAPQSPPPAPLPSMPLPPLPHASPPACAASSYASCCPTTSEPAASSSQCLSHQHPCLLCLMLPHHRRALLPPLPLCLTK